MTVRMIPHPYGKKDTVRFVFEGCQEEYIDVGVSPRGSGDALLIHSDSFNKALALQPLVTNEAVVWLEKTK